MTDETSMLIWALRRKWRWTNCRSIYEKNSHKLSFSGLICINKREQRGSVSNLLHTIGMNHVSDNANSQLFTAQDAALFSLHKMPAVVLIFCSLSPFSDLVFYIQKLNKGVSDSICTLLLCKILIFEFQFLFNVDN